MLSASVVVPALSFLHPKRGKRKLAQLGLRRLLCCCDSAHRLRWLPACLPSCQPAQYYWVTARPTEAASGKGEVLSCSADVQLLCDSFTTAVEVRSQFLAAECCKQARKLAWLSQAWPLQASWYGDVRGRTWSWDTLWNARACKGKLKSVFSYFRKNMGLWLLFPRRRMR